MIAKRRFLRGSIVAAILVLASACAPAFGAPVKNIVLVHGAWVDASGWKAVYEILADDGYNVTLVQEPLTSLKGDVAATKRILDLQDGPTILVELARHARAFQESTASMIAVTDDKYADLPSRMGRLEAEVFAPRRR